MADEYEKEAEASRVVQQFEEDVALQKVAATDGHDHAPESLESLYVDLEIVQFPVDLVKRLLGDASSKCISPNEGAL